MNDMVENMKQYTELVEEYKTKVLLYVRVFI